MSKNDPSTKLAKINAAIERWQRRQTRAGNALAKLYRQKKRLEAAATAPPKPKRPAKPKLEFAFKHGLAEPIIGRGKPEPAPTPADDSDALDVRSQPWAKPNAADEAAKAKLIADRAERKKQKAAGQAAARKAKAKGDTRRMPLSGKAALDYINKDA